MRGLCIAAMLYAAAPASAATWNPLEMRFDEQLPDIINFASKRCLESPPGTYDRYERVKRHYWREDDCGVPLDMAAIPFLSDAPIASPSHALTWGAATRKDAGLAHHSRTCGCAGLSAFSWFSQPVVTPPVPGPVMPAPVPLPASGLVLLAGLVALMFGRVRA